MNMETKSTAEENVASYEGYRASGGILNDVEYARVMMKVKAGGDLDKHNVLQAKNMALFAELETQPDSCIALYSALRGETIGSFTHESDQVLFAEALRMQGNTESLKKFKLSLPNIFPLGN